ncbi:S8 family serine peptidase [Corynebacterium comes]|uniref:Thermostable alkaline protease n=1 Tax=Corynebacterium comes TaxID=2675218 RepID=A0A6B8WA26_9CORY|nr:S8 family serine peptidase [Corynebacterium comes]QGU03778.1 Thermostable alkaline protease precursor [Corynebacterium comes]
MRCAVLGLSLLAFTPVPAAAQAPDVACTQPVEALGPVGSSTDMHRIAAGEGVRVAVIDTGVADHPHLVVEPVADLVSPSSPDPHLDCDGHGTVVAGVINGVAPGAVILSIRQSSAHHRQVDGGPAGTLASLADAIHRALDAGAHVINASVVSCLDPAVPLDARPIHDALHRAETEGVVVVAAAGNSGSTCRPGMVVYPAHEDTVLSVAAVHPGDPHSVADYVMPGAHHVSAPGLVDVGLSPTGRGWASGVVTTHGQETGFEGTSFAAPVVSGAAALLRQRHPHDSAAQIRDRILQAAEPGPGVVDPHATLTHLSGEYRVAGRGVAVEKDEAVTPRAPGRSAAILSGLGVALLLGVLIGPVRGAARRG